MPNHGVRAAAEGMPTERDIVEAYRQWLFYEGRLCGMELYPARGKDAEKLIPETFAGRFHFPIDSKWTDVPQPSTRARLVLGAVGMINEDGAPIYTPRERLDFHAREFARAARDIDPLATECWVGDGVGDNPQRYMVIVSHKLGKGA